MDIPALSKQAVLIKDTRKAQLLELASLIKDEEDRAQLIIICTHNSRRSQLTELWINFLANHHNYKNIVAYSGGTEATAFNHRMVKAVEKFGFNIDQIEKGDNPRYEYLGRKMFSKKYDHSFNPQKDFIAVLVCDSADEACPIVTGAKHRFPLKYKDPKSEDDTAGESKAYTDKVAEIGREMVYLFEELSKY